MKNKILFLILLFCVFNLNAQDKPVYNKALADSLGADEYGMKSYIFAILKTGPVKEQNKAKLDSLFRGHMANINRLAKMDKLVVAGPFGKNDQEYRGLFILNVKTIEEANELILTDPAIKAKIFEVDLFKWYGSAALPVYLKVHESISKSNP